MIDRKAIKRQQLVLKHLGYYSGEIDGIWSNKSIEAKIAFERSGKYNPCVPNNGMPFVPGVRLPEGLYYDAKGYVAVIGFDVDTLQKVSQKEPEPIKPPQEKPEQPAPQQQAPAQQQQPVVEKAQQLEQKADNAKPLDNKPQQKR